MTKRIKTQFYPSAMSVAGSDSGGGAGIAADLRTFNALGVYGTCAITAVTSQNPAAVRRIDQLPDQAVTAQIEAVMERIPVRFIKTGMLFSSENIRAVSQAVKKYDLELICDPVMISTSGKRLLQDEAVETLKSELFPLAAWITPNLPEAEAILDEKITSLPDMLAAAKELADLYDAAVWLKGGHLKGNQATDVIARDGKCYTVSSPKLETAPLTSHGTGCTLSAALTGMLALDFSWKQAVCASKAFVYGSLMQSVEIGPDLPAMYPPTEDFYQLIKLTEAESK